MSPKIAFSLFLLGAVTLLSCQTNQVKSTPGIEPGTFKVAILYPSGEDKTFDLDYYEKNHMPMVAGFLGDNLKFYEIEAGIAGRGTDIPPYLAIGYFYVKDVAEYNKAIGQHIDTIRNDFKNYTNIQPIVQISEIKQVIYPSQK